MMLLFRTPFWSWLWGSSKHKASENWGDSFQRCGSLLVRLSWASCDLAKGPLAAAFLHMLQVNKDKILEIPFVPSELHLHTSRSFKALFRYSRAVCVRDAAKKRKWFQSWHHSWRCDSFPPTRESQVKELEGEVQELKNNISQLQLERSELITKVINRVICTGAVNTLS